MKIKIKTKKTVKLILESEAEQAIVHLALSHGAGFELVKDSNCLTKHERACLNDLGVNKFNEITSELTKAVMNEN